MKITFFLFLFQKFGYITFGSFLHKVSHFLYISEFLMEYVWVI